MIRLLLKTGELRKSQTITARAPAIGFLAVFVVHP
jgi:hypothetical protein